MTLQIKSTDIISGTPLKEVRAFFRHLVSWHQHSFEMSALQEYLSLDNESAQTLANELRCQGYVQTVEQGMYELTEMGEELVRASAAGSISRKTAEAALAGLLERAEKYNSDPSKILTVEAVVIFGSFLGTKEKLGDLDVAIKHRDRDPNDSDRATTALTYAKNSGRHFGTFVDCLCWPTTELHQILKAKKRTIVIQEWDTFLRMVVKNPDHFEYKVMFGNPEQVDADIAARLRSGARS